MIEKKQERMKINDVLSPVKGIFSEIDFDFRIISKEKLDIMFFILFGEKPVAPLLNYYIRDGTLTTTSLQSISEILLSYYEKKWIRLLEVLEIEYDVIHNFSDTTTEKIQGSSDIKNNINSTKTTKDKTTNNETIDESNTLTNDLSTKEENNLTNTNTKNLSTSNISTDEESLQGFNSTTYVNSEKDTNNSTKTESGTDTVTKTGNTTTTNTGTSKNVVKSTIGNLLEKDLSLSELATNNSNTSNTLQRTLTRIGNIGNITTQQMLKQEIELWEWNFIQTVLDDVKDITTLPIYI